MGCSVVMIKNLIQRVQILVIAIVDLEIYSEHAYTNTSEFTASRFSVY